MKKSSSLVIIIPLVVAAIVIGLVFVMRVKSKASEPVTNPIEVRIPALKDEAVKPASGFNTTTTNSSQTSPVSDLETDLNGAAPTNDTEEFDTLQNEASAL